MRNLFSALCISASSMNQRTRVVFVMLVHKLGKETRRTALQLQTIVCGKTVDMSVTSKPYSKTRV